MQAKDLEKHQWTKRIIVISSPDFSNKMAEDQLQHLQGDLNALQDRKLIVYHVTNQGFTKDFSSEIFPSKNIDSEITQFTTTLIGLDGSEKLRTSTSLPALRFFEVIDQMPMRKNELKRQK